ncbi:MAG: PIG-L family deacetylase, partial [Candidatus Omnitrophica bacterium]|nr:PIG-L family deacetylase [Candidatus Omnitrophota bacterium]
MKNKILLLFLIFIFLSGCAGKPDVKMVAQERITPLVVFDSLYPFTKEDNILIFAPHPDDEAIGCAGVIQKALKTGAKVNVVYLTNGDHNQFAFIVYEKRIVFRKGAFIHMGEVRRKEAVKAMELLGLKEENLVFLGYPDFGTFAIFCRFWNAEKPFRSLLTRIARVPYKDNLSYHAPYVGESVLKDLKTVLLKYKPNKIFVSHPADVNGDHKALYLYLQIALLELKNELVPPKVFPYLIHFPGWPRPRHYHPELSLQAPRQFMDSSVDWLTLEMDKEQIDKKHEAVLCYKSQTQSSAFYLLSFCRRNELFGDYPPVHLSNQISLKERAVSFFGVSALHPALDS